MLTEKWLPLIDKFNGYFETNLQPSKGIYVNSFDENTKSSIEKYLLSLGFPALHGLFNTIIRLNEIFLTLKYLIWISGLLHAVETLKSIVLATCCLHQDISVKDAVLLSKMEEEYQVIIFIRVTMSITRFMLMQMFYVFYKILVYEMGTRGLD